MIVVAITAFQPFDSDARASVAHTSLEVAGHGGAVVPGHDNPDCGAVSCPLTILPRPQQVSFTKTSLSLKLDFGKDTVLCDRVPDQDPPVPRGGHLTI